MDKDRDAGVIGEVLALHEAKRTIEELQDRVDELEEALRGLSWTWGEGQPDPDCAARAKEVLAGSGERGLAEKGRTFRDRPPGKPW